MSDAPKSGREALMRMDSERNHLEILIRRSVDAAVAEHARHHPARELIERVAYQAAKTAVEVSGQQMLEARRIAETLAKLTPSPLVLPPETA